MPDINFSKPRTESIKENARPRRLPFVSFVKKENGFPKITIGIRKKKISKEELQDVLNKIKQRLKLSNKKKQFITIGIFIILAIPTFLVARYFYNSIKKGQEIAAKNLEKSQEKRHQLIVEGYELLKENNFYMAKSKFKKASWYNSEDYLLQVGLTTCYIRLCRYHGHDCKKAKQSLEELEKTHGLMPEVKQLKQEYLKLFDKN